MRPLTPTSIERGISLNVYWGFFFWNFCHLLLDGEFSLFRALRSVIIDDFLSWTIGSDVEQSSDSFLATSVVHVHTFCVVYHV